MCADTIGELSVLTAFGGVVSPELQPVFPQGPCSHLSCGCVLTLPVWSFVFVSPGNPVCWEVPEDPRLLGLQVAAQAWTWTSSCDLAASPGVVYTITEPAEWHTEPDALESKLLIDLQWPEGVTLATGL